MGLFQRFFGGFSKSKYMKDKGKIGVLFVCMGNICRSPTAEAVFRQKAEEARLDLHIDSAGTIGSHAGEKPDPRSVKAGMARGYDFAKIRSRQVMTQDFDAFDYVLAMDKHNLDDLLALKPEGAKAEVSLFLDYAHSASESEVPDPYYGGSGGFEQVLDLVEMASDGFIERLRAGA